jgi:hypothetical protein
MPRAGAELPQQQRFRHSRPGGEAPPHGNMSYELVLSDEAQDTIEEQVQWYEVDEWLGDAEPADRKPEARLPCQARGSTSDEKERRVTVLQVRDERGWWPFEEKDE